MFNFDKDDVAALKLLKETSQGKRLIQRMEEYLLSLRSTDLQVADGALVQFQLGSQNGENRLLQKIILSTKKEDV